MIKRPFIGENWRQLQPVLVPDSVFLPTVEGVLFRNNQEVFEVKGQSFRKLAQMLIPRMDGTVHLDHLLNGVDGPRLDMCLDLLETLFARRFLRDGSEDEAAGLQTWEREVYVSQIGFLAQNGDQPLQRFIRFRHTRFLVIADEAFREFLIEQLVRNGARNVLLQDPNHPAQDDQRSLQESNQHYWLSHRHSLEEAVSEADMVLVAVQNDRDVWRRAGETAARFHKDFLAALILDGEVICGPLVTHHNHLTFDRGLWRLAAAETGSRRHHYEQAARGEIMHECSPASPQNAVIPTCLLAFEAFKHRSGCRAPETTNALVIQSLESMTSSRHPIPTISATTSDPNHAQAELEHLWKNEEQKRETEVTTPYLQQILDRFKRFQDSRTGIFSDFDDHRLMQLPIKRSAVSVRFAQSDHKPYTCFGAGAQNILEARVSALLGALKCYALVKPGAIQRYYAPLTDRWFSLPTISGQVLGCTAVGFHLRTTLLEGLLDIAKWCPKMTPGLLQKMTDPLNSNTIHRQKTKKDLSHNLNSNNAAINPNIFEPRIAGHAFAGVSTTHHLSNVLRRQSEDPSALTAYLTQTLSRFGLGCKTYPQPTFAGIHRCLVRIQDGKTKDILGSGLTQEAARTAALLDLTAHIQAQAQGEPAPPWPVLNPEFRLHQNKEETPLDPTPATLDSVLRNLATMGWDILMSSAMPRDFGDVLPLQCLHILLVGRNTLLKKDE